ncbi:hypothetical protein [Hyphobacterium sp.]|uniref:hypothetical protein n=1 Tax=Hyphobacterium sp. TaxID=2004662 RepID=UPI003B51E92A
MGQRKGRPSRRSFLRQIVGGAALTGGLTQMASAQNRSWSARYAACASGVTDSDGGAEADPVGNGQGSGVTDRDTGETADRAGYGRGERSYTDTDRGAHADPVGGGTGSVRMNDSDVGFGSDPVGRGRGGDRLREASNRPCPVEEPEKPGEDG